MIPILFSCFILNLNPIVSGHFTSFDNWCSFIPLLTDFTLLSTRIYLTKSFWEYRVFSPKSSNLPPYVDPISKTSSTYYKRFRFRLTNHTKPLNRDFYSDDNFESFPRWVTHQKCKKDLLFK